MNDNKPVSNFYDITEFYGFSRNGDDYELNNTYPTSHLQNMGLDYSPNNLIRIDSLEQFINFDTEDIFNLVGQPIHHDYFHANSSNVSTICDVFFDENKQIIIKTIPGFGLCQEFHDKLYLPEMNLNDMRELIDVAQLDFDKLPKQPFGPRMIVSIYNPSNNTVSIAIVIEHSLYSRNRYRNNSNDKYLVKFFYPDVYQRFEDIYPDIARSRNEYIKSDLSGTITSIHEKNVWPLYDINPENNQRILLPIIKAYNQINPYVLTRQEKNDFTGLDYRIPNTYVQRALPSSVFNVLPDVYDNDYTIERFQDIHNNEQDNINPLYGGNTNYYDYNYHTINDLSSANSYFFKSYPDLKNTDLPNITNLRIGGKRKYQKKSLHNKKKYHSRKKYKSSHTKSHKNKKKHM